MSAPRMTAAQYDAYVRRIGGRAENPPRADVRAHAASKWSDAERSYFHGVLGGVGEYEGETIRITPDWCAPHVYTPDFVTTVDVRDPIGHGLSSDYALKVYHEVKGLYRLGSQDGARLRWTFAAIARPDCVFVWAKATKAKGRWDVEIWYDGGRLRLKRLCVKGFKIDGKGGAEWQL